GDPLELLDHRLLKRRVAVVELKRVGPTREVRVATVGQQQVTALALDPDVVRGRARQVPFGSDDIVVGVIFDPRMIDARVVGDEVEHQSQIALSEPLAETVEGSISSKISVHRVAGDREPRTGNILLTQVRESFLKLPAPFRIAPRDSLPRVARLPHAQEPDPVEAHLRDAVQLGVGNVVERGPSPDDARQLRQPHPGVDLEQRRIAVARHGFCAATAAAVSTYPVFPASSIFCGSMVAQRCIKRAMTPVQPVWWLAPSPAPLSPWKYS